MSFQITILHANGKPFDIAQHIELLHNGVVVARSSVQEGGVVTFDVPVEEGETLAIRLGRDQDPQPQAGR